MQATLGSHAAPSNGHSSGARVHSKNRPVPLYTVSFPTPSFDCLTQKELASFKLMRKRSHIYQESEYSWICLLRG